ncbi:hypothetical protein WLH_00401 [Escherichia coli O25b:H4]|uniref:Uncharacterized protein n=1 Tax=Escherichia coli O25b:H4 TaxID=941280 RepID=A0A192C796_ECO25|nr:hypothetical protein WLH_00401 [Escherichia coli O25b:H4]
MIESESLAFGGGALWWLHPARNSAVIKIRQKRIPYGSSVFYSCINLAS